ncbi:MAG: T9SS type A sorting domain-containing protein [Flavobacterium sp.]
MKKLYFLFFLTIGFFANAQIVNIPDANFKATLLSANSSNIIARNLAGYYFTIDSNNDGEIQIIEAQQVKQLNIANKNISNLTGIEAFINLDDLGCSNNLLTALNVSACTNLTRLTCSSNQLTSLNVQSLTGLVALYVTNNQLTSLNVQGLNLLQILDCGRNMLTLLNVQGCSNLTSLICYNNFLTSIDLQGLINIRSLNCQNNVIQELDIQDSSYLYSLTCSNNNLVSLNIKNSIGSNAPSYSLNFSNNPNLQYICADENEIIYVQNLITTYGYNAICHVNSYCSFAPGGIYYNILGKTKFDFNTNGCDIADINYTNLKFNITDGINSGNMIANITGDYFIPVQSGNLTITPNLENPSYFNISPESVSVNFPTQTSPFTRDFCVTANGIHHDVEIMIIPTVPARPGFDANYKLVYSNKGNQVENGSISLTFDDAKLDYVAANPVFNSSAVNNFTWNYTNLQPFETREIALVLSVNSPIEIPAVNIGDQINFLAEITPFTNDEIQYDNISALKQIVVGSYDPNDKRCLEGETADVIIVGEYVHYVIRFENTGTYPAENIVVKDMIDLAKFDIATLVPLKSSHDFFTIISGNKVEFIFENINLDFNDATNDGYVVFKIKTKPTLIVGDTFTNNANIYFDYNFPITTNTYSTTITALSSQDFDFGTYFTLYPNPAKDILNIQSKQDVAINSVEIYNQLGQIVMASTNTLNTIDVSNLASGTYFVKINTEKGSANAKFVKE